jgi:hypothetical protein
MNPKHSDKPLSDRLSHLEPDLNAAPPEVPDFVVVPRIPGLPPEVTGSALRSALQIRAKTGVTIHRL